MTPDVANWNPEDVGQLGAMDRPGTELEKVRTIDI
jgi:hypothetical protein